MGWVLLGITLARHTAAQKIETKRNEAKAS